MKVHSTLGNGFQEVIYQRCLAIELEKAGIQFVREVEMPIFYDNHEVGTRRADFVIESKILVELKALIALEDVHLAQSLNYLETYRLDIGLLINFGARSLQFKRLLSRSNKSQSSGISGQSVLRASANSISLSRQSDNPANPDSGRV
ncbi:MAG TPA: GxxExxY protein [Fibrobacteres bacterium]|nr:GxxExxY protein [Fibrobacterota bacterium]